MKLYKIKKSKIDNKRGLYATKDIKEGTKIINYIGKIITNREVEQSAKFDNTKPIYLFTLNNKYTLDGDFHWNTAGLINHSCNNNCDYEGKGLKVWVTSIKDINASGVSILLVEQNAKRALGFSDRGYVLDQGRNAYQGSGEELLNDPRVIDLYLGKL